MDIPRGHAMLPLTEADALDFIYNYFKAEYAPIRSLWSTATAEPKQPSRWVNMGRELVPLSIRAANAQAQKDLESLDYFIRQRNLDPVFVHGLVIRYAMFEVHERMEKKLYECARLDLMVRKALKEKHLIDALWPSPAPRNLSQDLLSQGVQVRRWYGDMFAKYFTVLHSVDDFRLRPEVDAKIKSSGTLMLLPYVDHLIMGGVDPIRPIVAKGSGYSSVKRTKKDSRSAAEALSFGEPDRFEIRFDAPSEVTETYTKSVARQCQCMKCGTKRDVQVVISVDPNPGPVNRSSEVRPSQSRAPPAAKRQSSKTAQRYTPGYDMPGTHVEDAPPPHPPRPHPEAPSSPPAEQKKQCPRCTFLNHKELTSCEMCGGDIQDSPVVTKPPTPPLTSAPKPSHSHSQSQPQISKPNEKPEQKEGSGGRPAPLNRHSISSTLFSIFPFSQQHQQEHHPNLPPTQPTVTDVTATGSSVAQSKDQPQDLPKATNKSKHIEQTLPHRNKAKAKAKELEPKAEPEAQEHSPSTSQAPDTTSTNRPETPLSRAPEMAMMPLTPSSGPSDDVSPSQHRLYPAGLPQNLMDDFVPVSPSFPKETEEEDAGWGEMSREEANGSSSDDDDDIVSRREGLVDLDAVAREEMGVWGDREED